MAEPPKALAWAKNNSPSPSTPGQSNGTKNNDNMLPPNRNGFQPADLTTKQKNCVGRAQIIKPTNDRADPSSSFFFTLRTWPIFDVYDYIDLYFNDIFIIRHEYINYSYTSQTF